MAAAKKLLLPLTLLFTFIIILEASKILFLLPFASKSHKNVFDPLMYELSNRNHDITVVSPFKLPKEEKNIREIVIVSSMMKDENVLKSIFDWIGMPPHLMFFVFKPMLTPIFEGYLENSDVQELIKAGRQFDVVIVSAFMNECAMMTAPLLGKNVILLSGAALVPWGKSFQPEPLSFVPNLMLPYTDEMSFFQRFNNLWGNMIIRLTHKYYLKPAFENIVRKHLPDAPSVDEVDDKVAMVLTNVDPVMTCPRPTMPNVVNVGAMHCQDPKPLPKDFEDFIQSSGEDGFIVFGLGSNAQSRFLPAQKKEAFIKAFSQLKQKVIWKYEENLENLPANVKITPWMPQQDLLGHPKCRLFISHGGLLSMQETVYHGTPVIGIPLFGDQPANIAMVKKLHIGDGIDFTNITTEGVLEKVQKILNDKSYAENVKKYSAIMRDRPQHPSQLAAFWVEYVIRHDGAAHFKSGGDKLNFVQYFMLDVIGVILVILSTLLYFSCKASRLILNKIYGCKKSVKKTKKTQ